NNIIFSKQPDDNHPQILHATESLEILFGTHVYRFIMQTDCNLVLYDNNNPIWATNTGGLGNGCRAVLQPDGVLVVITNENVTVWQSPVAGKAGHYVLVLQPDRNVVIYGDALWATQTVR
uniref:PROTEIN (LECTIN) n=1 Tax=Hyacinthoides hispanica TaxID=81759 RepID=UPI0000110733|nr:Chain A, PROTEIN (LECTIN) [Hyacinthoides hispanica]1B2P_B Chain B, PROTEIN (LECTIN) [Hyacinthoides hispanica]